MRFRLLGVLAALPWLIGSAGVQALEGDDTTTAASAASAETSSNRDDSAGVVVVALRGDELPREPLRAGLAKELAAPVVFESEQHGGDVRGVVTIHYARERQELAVTWDGVGRTVSRVITAAMDPNDVLQDSVLLAGNLSRDQVDDLVAPKPAQPAPAAPAPAAPAPAAPARRPRAEPTPKPVPPAPPRLFATASFFYPLATHHDRPDATSSFDLNVVYGKVGAIDGAELGVVNVVTRDESRPAFVAGLQLGLVANVVNGSVQGLQAASLLSASCASAWTSSRASNRGVSRDGSALSSDAGTA